jgi:hypothetical protein
MTSTPFRRSLRVLAAVALILVALEVAWPWLSPRAHEQLAQRYRQALATASDDAAAKLLTGLAQDDDKWIDLLAESTLDERLPVARAAATALRGLVQRWAALPPSEASPRAAKLAHALAASAPNCQPDSRSLFHSLAEQMIGWPIDGRAIDASAFTADCQTVLMLPVAERLEVRIALAQPPVQPETKPEEPVADSAPELVVESPAPILSVEPATPTAVPPPALPPPSTSLQTPVPMSPTTNEPARFVPGRGRHISDD